MSKVGIISGSGFYDLPNVEDRNEQDVSTPYGNVTATTGKISEVEVIFISRHGKGHKLLPNMINFRANMNALKQLGVESIISTTVCGILNPKIELAKLLVFKDLYFPDNRLPSGELCTMYHKENDPLMGHYIFSNPFSTTMKTAIAKLMPCNQNVVYAHVNGPRLNSIPEIKSVSGYADAVSQTAGPEIVLAGELEIPIVLLGFGVDYANGVISEPTPPETITKNLQASSTVFTEVITQYLAKYQKPVFEGFIYRFNNQ